MDLLPTTQELDEVLSHPFPDALISPMKGRGLPHMPFPESCSF